MIFLSLLEIFTHVGDTLLDNNDVKQCPVYPVILHRAMMKTDMIAVFKEPGIFQKNIDITFISHNGRVGDGKGGGVLRDAITLFWQQFFNGLTVGAQEWVPAYLRLPKV